MCEINNLCTHIVVITKRVSSRDAFIFNLSRSVFISSGTSMVKCFDYFTVWSDCAVQTRVTLNVQLLFLFATCHSAVLLFNGSLYCVDLEPV